MQKCIVICGQTASGKSSLAVNIALELVKNKQNIEIISADSRQVYTDFDITSAKITKKEMNGIPHHMLDITLPENIYTVADYVKDASFIINKLHKEKTIPIICGGTGLYIDNLIYKKTIPEVLPNKNLRKILEQKTTEELFNILKNKDKVRANTIDSKNKIRLIRALEIIEEIGHVPVEIEPVLKYKTLFIGLYLPKDILEENIKERTKQRMDLNINENMVNEIKKVHTKYNISYEQISKFGMEYKWVSEYIQNKITKQECIDGINKDTLSYAKRQMTWFKKNKDIIWFDNTNNKETLNNVMNLVKDFISS